MARRKSFGKAVRVNTKGLRVTSTSFGGKGMRINASSKGLRMYTTNPITGTRRSMSLTSGVRASSTRSRGPRQPQIVATPQYHASLPHDFKYSSRPKKRGWVAAVIVALFGVIVSGGSAAFAAWWSIIFGPIAFFALWSSTRKQEARDAMEYVPLPPIIPSESIPASTSSKMPERIPRPAYVPQPDWADRANSSWEDYERWFFWHKDEFPGTAEWRTVLEICHRHWNLNRVIMETYRRRDVEGVEPTIAVCREQMLIAAEVREALQKHHELEETFRKYDHQAQIREWRQRGWGEFQRPEPAPSSFTLPEHRGFKQLAVIYDKMKDYPAAIEVCREASAVDWPGDWDVRIARYERRLANQQKKGGMSEAPIK